MLMDRPCAQPAPELEVRWNGSMETAAIKAQQMFAPAKPARTPLHLLRLRIREFLHSHPGASTTALAECFASASRQDINHSLYTLERQGRIVREPQTQRAHKCRPAVWRLA